MPDLRQMTGKTHARDVFKALFSLTKAILQVVLVFGTLGGTVVSLLVVQELVKIPDLSYLKNYKPVDSIAIYDKDDQLIESVDAGLPRTVIAYKDLPRVLVLALMAAEDKHFFEHHGVSPQGILRAVLANAKAMQMKEGGSTITQQLAKNLFFLDVKRTGIVKIAEMIVANRLEDKFSKEEILSLYLTEIYFGEGARGIEQAAQTYFGKSANALNLQESAFLAGIIRSPSYLGQKSHRKAAIERQRQVLQAMQESNYITMEAMMRAEATPLEFRRARVKEKAYPFTKFPYFTSYVLEQVRGSFSEHAIGLNGLKIYTTLDPVAQTLAEKTLAQEIRRAPLGIEEEALVALSTKDSAIRALVGGAHDFWQNQWNCAVNPHTAGSSIKPFIYLTAFMAGIMTPESTVLDAPFEMEDQGGKWTPKNFDGKYLGNITVRDALMQSRNMCTIRVTEQVGIKSVISTLDAAGIKSKMSPTLALALGSSAVTPLELAGAYATLARGGLATPPWTIRRIEDARGKIISYYQPSICRVFPQEQVTWLTDILQDVVARGTGTLARLDRPTAGKTGTADKAKDIWFVGFTPDMVTCVWGGGDEKKDLGRNVTGGTVMARVFRNFNERFYQAVKTPEGELLTSRYNDLDKPHEAVKPISHSNDVPLSEIDPSYTSTQTAGQYQARPRAAAHSQAVRSQKGITEYKWEE
ncbi:MAG: PBP1A family penicillin-binding protein [Candidatus Obscuribacterales bacterium]|nr:PBP1A family penicillin-binding protein [Candidatus Obscuribacterales bacterium]